MKAQSMVAVVALLLIVGAATIAFVASNLNKNQATPPLTPTSTPTVSPVPSQTLTPVFTSTPHTQTATPTPISTPSPETEPSQTPDATANPISTPNATTTPNPTAYPGIIKEEVRDFAIAFIKSNHPESAQFMNNLVWTGGRTTPSGIVGSETYTYYSAGWNVTITHPVVPNPVFSVLADFSAVGVSIPYRIIWKGTWQNEAITETSYVFAQ